MSDSHWLLEAIARELETHGEDVVANLRINGEQLTACEGQLRVEVKLVDQPSANEISHCHFISQVGSDTSRNLDACLIGVGKTLNERLASAAKAWNLQVAAPILSLMTRETLHQVAAFDCHSEDGVAQADGCIGPRVGRELHERIDWDSLSDVNLFENVAAMAPPEYLQLAKVTLSSHGERWRRSIEFNGHQFAIEDPHWMPRIKAATAATISQFAVFHFANHSEWVEQRQQLDNAICHFVAAFAENQDINAALATLSDLGLAANQIHQIFSFVSLAFSRSLFADLGATYAGDYWNVSRCGKIVGRKLLDEPAFARSLAMSADFFQGDLADSCTTLSLLNPEFNQLNQLMNEGHDPLKIALPPPVIPDHDVDPDRLRDAVREIENRR